MSLSLTVLSCGAADPVADEGTDVSNGEPSTGTPSNGTSPISNTPGNETAGPGPSPMGVGPNPGAGGGAPSPQGVAGSPIVPPAVSPTGAEPSPQATPTTPDTPVVSGGGAPPIGVAGMMGTGGTPPSGGAGMAAIGGSSGTPVSMGLGCSGNELLCEDFEGTADGALPTGSWLPIGESCQYQAAQFSMGVSTEQVNPASGSTKALKITNKHFAECRLSGSFGASDDFWVRAYMYWGTELDLTSRETLAMDLTPGAWVADDSHAIRFGYRSKAPCEEYAGPQVTIIGLSGGESTGCGSRAMPQGEWFCFEAHVNQASTIEVNTYINGEAISYQSTGKPLVTSIVTDTVATEKVDHVRLGLFSTSEAQGNVYVDDLAVTTTRVGCGN